MILSPRTRTGNAIAIILILSCGVISSALASDRAAWMQEKQWGVMSHYLEDWIARRENMPGARMSVEKWNEVIDHFDTEALATQLDSVGAGWFQISIGQNSGFYLSPNSTYDRLTRISPAEGRPSVSKCSHRDLIADLYESLHRRNIRLMVYLPSGAPGGDAEAAKALQFHRGPDRNSEFQRNWEAVISEWSTRWGSKVDGWWFDGCYWPNAMYRAKEPPNFETFAAAARAGNPNSAVAFNPGVLDRLIDMSPFEDYTAGELNEPDRLMVRRVSNGRVDGAVPHVLTFLGVKWGTAPARYSVDEAVKYTLQMTKAGAAVTWDTPIETNGTYSQEFMDRLAAVGKAMKK